MQQLIEQIQVGQFAPLRTEVRSRGRRRLYGQRRHSYADNRHLVRIEGNVCSEGPNRDRRKGNGDVHRVAFFDRKASR